MSDQSVIPIRTVGKQNELHKGDAIMKKLILAALVAMLAACSGPTDIKLSEMNQPQNAKKLLETLSPQDRAALQAYVMRHTMQKDIDFKMTVKEAIEARKAEVAKEQGVANAIK